ncbi:HNH endonuclease signature motif containing protein [Microbacterium sp. cf332]|uniref:HNH endonuclease signature motif containing protein n=1 Tax=Microbacterium sp. cf332 TaxID=1761804 RepID=UPI000883323F|nr:HNH endonuclease signature motif containing protein [Microbacterium sp. cf332]SDQ95330.1 protein of unknown function [Microbacterium sp. cf332]
MTANGDRRVGRHGSRRDAPDAGSFATYSTVLDRVVDADKLLHDAQITMTRALADAGRAALERTLAGDSRPRGMGSDMEMRSVAAEIAGVRRTHDRRAQTEIDHALTIVDDYPAVFAAWEHQRITREHVDAVVRAGCAIEPDLRADYEQAAITICERDIASRVREPLRNLAAHMGSATFTERHRAAAAKRGVWVMHGNDGMSELSATVPTVVAAGIHDRLTAMAQSVKDARCTPIVTDAVSDAGAGSDADLRGVTNDREVPTADVRTMDQLRADILGDLLLGGAPVVDPSVGSDGAGPLGAIRAHVQVAVTADTLRGVDEAPAEAVGAALIDADTARHLAGRAKVWSRLFIDPVTRTPVEVDTYRPTTAMSRLLRARDQHCRFPGCRRPAVRCELDHTIDHALGGHTHIFNLAHLCQRHHSMKQFTAWKVRQVGGGVIEWTSPLGRIYREDVPVPTVCFVPEASAAPPPDPTDAPPDEQPPF